MVNKFRLDTKKNIETKEVINRTLAIAKDYAGELTIEVIPLDKIELDPDNNRELTLNLHDAINGIKTSDPEYEKKKQDWQSLESLAKTISNDQLINPIFVYRFGNMCRLIAGERRTLASAIAGKREIIARIASERPVGTKLKILQWIENNERVDLKLSERIASLEVIIKEYLSENKEKNRERMTSKVLSDLTGMSITQARRYLLILQARPEIKEAISKGQLENIKLIELLCSVENENHQEELLSTALNNASFESIIKLKKEYDVDQIKKKDLRGRKKVNINLGSIKLTTLKVILEALTQVATLEKNIINEVSIIADSIPWDNSEKVEKLFKKIVTVLENEAVI